MKRDDLWADAIAKAEAALKQTTAADQVAILTVDDQVRALVSFEHWVAMNLSERTALAAQRLAASIPPWHATHLGNALIAAAETIEDAEKRDPHTGPRRIVLIADLQKGSRLDGLQGHEWPRGLEVVVEQVKAKRPTNAGLQWVMDAEDSARTAADSPVRIRVNNSTDAKTEQFQIRWAGVAGGDSLDAYVPPGQSRIVPAPKLPTNTVAERITLNGDEDDFDNSVYVVTTTWTTAPMAGVSERTSDAIDSSAPSSIIDAPNAMPPRIPAIEPGTAPSQNAPVPSRAELDGAVSTR
jgi:hypothetical protein